VRLSSHRAVQGSVRIASPDARGDDRSSPRIDPRAPRPGHLLSPAAARTPPGKPGGAERLSGCIPRLRETTSLTRHAPSRVAGPFRVTSRSSSRNELRSVTPEVPSSVELLDASSFGPSTEPSPDLSTSFRWSVTGLSSGHHRPRQPVLRRSRDRLCHLAMKRDDGPSTFRTVIAHRFG
jgi:hypothetical protein